MAASFIGEINPKVFEYVWKIKMENFASIPIQQRMNSPIISFNCFNKEIKWHLFFFPIGESDDKEYDIFAKNRSIYEIKASIIFSLLNKDYEKINQRKLSSKIFTCTEGWGITKFVKQSFLQNINNCLLTDDEITVSCTLIVESIMNQDQKTFERINEFDDFEALLLNKNFSDLTVVSADNKKLSVHKNILATRSPIFKSLIEKGTTGNDQMILEINFKYDVLFEFFRFIYSGKVHQIKTIICELLSIANKFSVSGLKMLCEETMLINIGRDNAILYLIEADKNNCDTVIEKIIEFIVKNSKDIVKTKNFKSQMILHPHLLYQITNSLVYESKCQ